jgi:hypothetical protein
MSLHRPVRPEARTYRRISGAGNLQRFRVVVKETDLQVQAATDLSRRCRELIIRERGYLEAFIKQHPKFLTALTPWPASAPAPPMVAAMIDASRSAGVGPMAAVAGALAESVGRDLLGCSEEVIVENGGDIFLALNQPATVGIDAGRSPLSGQLGLRFAADDLPLAICTSSGTIGHSLSYGKAEAVCVVARRGALADASATAVANRIAEPRDLSAAIEFAGTIEGLIAVVAVCRDQMGAWGDVEIVPLKY